MNWKGILLRKLSIIFLEKESSIVHLNLVVGLYLLLFPSLWFSIYSVLVMLFSLNLLLHVLLLLPFSENLDFRIKLRVSFLTWVVTNCFFPWIIKVRFSSFSVISVVSNWFLECLGRKENKNKRF